MNQISVLIVDDSALMRNLIRRMLESEPGITVVGVAMNGLFALGKTETLKPDVIVLDLEMPELDGIGFLERRQKNGWDIPVVILSAMAKKGAEITIRALSLGASDFITKPTGGSQSENRDIAAELIGMVKAFGMAYRKRSGRLDETDSAEPKPAAPGAGAPAKTIPKPKKGPRGRYDNWPRIKPKRGPAPPEIIAIGVSTGGPNALRKVFSNLSPNLKVPIVVVQHMPPGFTTEFANSLNKVCPLQVKEAADGDLVKDGRILVAPGDKHVEVEKKRLAVVVRIFEGEKVNGHRPSVGVLFDSVAKEYGNASLAIIMTGMGRDGSREIGGVYAEGGITLAQDEESSVVFGMPRVAIEHDYVTHVVGLDNMAGAINEMAGALDREFSRQLKP